ncbi:hypothetical protein SAMN05519104_7791 [Rhizobiales bacterium GAS188]|nr:hypothetical protein SAMN05519104_7791 [Rhizobiales bacterium GAS188]
MADISIFFVVAFSRTEASELRAEAAIKARSKQHAVSLASHFAGEGQGAVAFSQMGESATAGGNAKILARFGDVPNDRALLRQFSSVWALSRPDITSALPINSRDRHRRGIR